MKAKNLLSIFILIVFLTSCVKEEGEGGTSSIKGIVTMQEFDKENQPIRSYAASNEDIFIIYGNNEIYNDDLKTNYDGKYIFKNLRKGNYKLFAYSDCESDTCSTPSLPVMVEVEITENNQILNVDEIIINKF